jgi:hypothetical protein
MCRGAVRFIVHFADSANSAWNESGKVRFTMEMPDGRSVRIGGNDHGILVLPLAIQHPV